MINWGSGANNPKFKQRRRRLVDTLVEKGLVKKGTIDDRTNSYTITNRGERELSARRKWEEGIVDSFFED